MRNFVKGLTVSLVLCCLQTASAESFTVDDIVVKGLQRVSLGNVLNVLTFKEGDVVDTSESSQWMHQVYQTGFFYDVEISKQDAVVVIDVVERPAIENISFDGNSTIPSDALTAVLDDIGLSKGEIFSQSLLETIQLELEKQYGAQGRYNAKVDAKITPLTRNRVDVELEISEGPVARISHLLLVGNETFSEEELAEVTYLEQRELGQIFKKKTNYSSAALAGDVQRLEDFYFDRGYLDFAVNSQQISISENKAEIGIALNLTEGLPYTINSVEITGDLKHLADEVKALSTLESGETYSRAEVTSVVANIKDLLGENGYAFAQVKDFRQLNPETQTVDVTLQVVLGSAVYVNRIIIQGNSATNDDVIRREMRQLERALVINKNIRASKARLERLGYFTSVNISTRAVPGRADLVNLVVSVVEAKDSQINFTAGYAGGSGAYAKFTLEQSNFMGKGVDFSSSIELNKSTTKYELSVQNPYFTIDGVSLGTDLFYRVTDYEKTEFRTYATNSYGANLKLGYPLSENQRINYGLGASRDEIFLSDTAATLEMTDFRDAQGSEYDIITAKLGWSYNTVNGAIKADKGSSVYANLELATPLGDLQYYRTTVAAQKFLNLSELFNIDESSKFADDFALRFYTDLGYGASYGDSTQLPFYKNFFAGGARSVRGFSGGSLGPKGTAPVDGDGNPTFVAAPIGGNIKVEYGAELIVPTPMAKNQNAFRTSLFIDAGNVFTDQCRSGNLDCDTGIDFNDIRYAAGVDLTWISPIAPLSFSYAWPLNAQEGDFETNFLFNVGLSY